jgi:hypothetical protein
MLKNNAYVGIGIDLLDFIDPLTVLVSLKIWIEHIEEQHPDTVGTMVTEEDYGLFSIVYRRICC